MLDLEEICRQLEKKICSEHNKHPTAVVSRNEIKISCCCNSFFGDLQYHIKKASSTNADNSTEDNFNPS